jgi:hypothetical protein
MPMVSLVEQFDHSGIDCVDVDHYKGISSAIESLVERGHRRIGFFTRRYEVEASWSFRRYAAFMEKMVRLRLPVSSKDVINMFPSRELSDEESIDHAAERSRAGVTAWVCAADHQAYDLVRGLRKRKMSVPGMVSVSGFDGIETPSDCPELATIQIPFREIGATGTQRLVERIRKQSLFHSIIESGAIIHAFVGEQQPCPDSIATLITEVFHRTQSAQVTISPEFTYCNACYKSDRGLQEKCRHCGSDNIVGETRVVGYFSKIQNWNKSKRYGELVARQRGQYAVEQASAGGEGLVTGEPEKAPARRKKAKPQ